MKGWVDFAAIKRAVRLEWVLLQHYQCTGLRRHGDQLQGCCPIHGGQRNDSFRASLSKNAFQCFACQAQGNVLDLVAAMERCSVREAALLLQQWFGVGGPDVRRRSGSSGRGERERELVRKKEMRNPVLGFALTGVHSGHSYLAQRGIEHTTAAQFGVGYYAGPGLLHRRIVIPIHDGWGQLVAYAGRATDGSEPKYKLPAGFRKGFELFNQHRAAATGSQTVIVVEGYFDCMRVHQAGWPWVIALMGSTLSAQQERVLLQGFTEIVVMLDGDAAGRAGSRAIVARLAGKCALAVVEVPDGTQPDMLPIATIDTLLKQREPMPNRIEANRS